MRRLLPVLLALALLGLVVPTGGPAVAAERVSPDDVVTRSVVFELVNSDAGAVRCNADHRPVEVRGRFVGPREHVLGRAAVTTVDVLVHDAGTGGWFFNLRGMPQYDYATQLARQGRTTLVIDRLGYDGSPLTDGESTCLGAQVHLLHQVVQHLYSGMYRSVGAYRDATRPQASHVVLHGHGTGATIAQLEASSFGDVRGVVLLSPPTTSPTRLALDVLRGQGTTCAGAPTFAPFGSATSFRRLLFTSAPAAVQRRAAALRNDTPCGDVATLTQALLATQLPGRLGGRDVEAPVLVLRGSRDARTTGAAAVGSETRLVRRTVAGAGNSLVLEKQAPAVRREVLRFVRSLPPSRR